MVSDSLAETAFILLDTETWRPSKNHYAEPIVRKMNSKWKCTVIHLNLFILEQVKISAKQHGQQVVHVSAAIDTNKSRRTREAQISSRKKMLRVQRNSNKFQRTLEVVSAFPSDTQCAHQLVLDSFRVIWWIFVRVCSTCECVWVRACIQSKQPSQWQQHKNMKFVHVTL